MAIHLASSWTSRILWAERLKPWHVTQGTINSQMWAHAKNSTHSLFKVLWLFHCYQFSLTGVFLSVFSCLMLFLSPFLWKLNYKDTPESNSEKWCKPFTFGLWGGCELGSETKRCAKFHPVWLGVPGGDRVSNWAHLMNTYLQMST